MYRGHRQRSKLQRHIRAAVHIQRIRRGYLARRAVEEGLEAKRKAAEAAVLEYYVRLVQAAFRGFYSRKYTHDFYARKAYIATVQQRGEALRAEMEEHHRQLQQVRRRSSLFSSSPLPSHLCNLLCRLKWSGKSAKCGKNLTASRKACTTCCPRNQCRACSTLPWQLQPARCPRPLNRPVEDHLRTATKQYLRENGLKASRKLRSYAKDGESLRVRPFLLHFFIASWQLRMPPPLSLFPCGIASGARALHFNA